MTVSEEIPEALALVTAFANSIDVESGSDDLTTVDGLKGWLAGHGRAADADPIGEGELRRARDFRAALRDELAAHHGTPGDARARLDRHAAGVPLRVWVEEDAMRLASAAPPGLDALLGDLLAAMLLAERDRTWQRLKICDAQTCREAYYDWSKNSSRRWCSMGVCGNRSKTRAYRAKKA